MNDDVTAVLEIFLRGSNELDDKLVDELSLVTAQLAPVLYRDMTRSELQNARDELDARVSLRTAELAQLAENLKCEVEQRRQAEVLKEELVATVSHELRTPLASLRGFSELILQRELPRAKQMQLVSVMNKEAIRLTELINDFLDIQRIESGRITCRMEQFLLSYLIDDLIEIFAPQDDLHRLELDLAYCPWVRGDQQRLKQALANYLSNAFKYSPNGGTVTISSRLEHPYLVVSVSDDGIGIPADVIDKLFTRFYRVDNADTRAIGGTGLGLALVKSIAEAHRGTVRVDSTPGQGSTFSLYLPDHFDGVGC
jgi:signal transduction histidine kinase